MYDIVKKRPQRTYYALMVVLVAFYNCVFSRKLLSMIQPLNLEKKKDQHVVLFSLFAVVNISSRAT